MSVLVKGMEKPEHCGYCRFRYGGICHALQKTQYSMDECPLVVIEDAGLNDTISRQVAIDALWKALYEYEDKTEKQFQESDELDVGDWMQHRIFVQNMSDIDRQTILALPSAERKKGEWIEEPNCWYRCSRCGNHYPSIRGHMDYNYCPSCGADMRKQKLQYGDEDTSQGGLMSAT